MVIEAASLCEECDERRANSCLFAYYNGAFVVLVAIQIAITVTKHVLPQFVVRGLVVLPIPPPLTI